MRKSVFVAIAALGVGVLGGAVIQGSLNPASFIRTAEAAPKAATYTYLCFSASSADDIQAKANAAGAEGWQLSAATMSPEGLPVWCFARPTR